jgi:cytochrome c biogenesis protein CcmG, thiol:disulfide interchange protein DsbE
MNYKIAILLIPLIALGIAGVGCSINTSPKTIGSTSVGATKDGAVVGHAAPDFQLTRMDGSRLALSELRGKPAVIVFWTAWCPVCKEEAPHFNALAAQYESRGVRVLGINIQDSSARTQSGINDFGIRYAVARDTDAAVARRYRVTGTPTVVFLDANGVVTYVGNQLPADYATRLDALLTDGA